ncbi:hypothetical protein H112_03236 [Trichophyton rubrum D6]|uniref:Uncharacterized protein n=2 Tax=Trichophyton TaxID=5550 RepID=A0A022W6I3_TRIRU|nr:hypothetical protein H100_03239 [Trichophyton rubrum MR850]EZF43346.1 hypothetical protein H102_03233 [Trichophyton rubrum CBS 100081]EZF53909.1 hypothetical protein H103_03247 [Trichophyton rubrum CBS 288.86]EZF64528.1 hypothetical protein H104_03230 [Trichophyton rubrum CBS 289.86]EZF75217.1 hypothetical protein H105_03251 [Trichophyton soudanense CBS 452.61]EZF85810.1 hypothetical protein H110_03241 [Trichophyton rubrum MR1448]EZF96615.1 hypothetical protein H113_03249 [Trichophyton rub
MRRDGLSFQALLTSQSSEHGPLRDHGTHAPSYIHIAGLSSNRFILPCVVDAPAGLIAFQSSPE